MRIEKKGILIKVFVLISYLIMIAVNALANILPINGMTTGQVSDAYPNLFAPAAITFSIWGLIYFLILGYVLYQLGLFHKEETVEKAQLIEKIGIYFISSSLLNAAWILAWHFRLIPISLIFMIGILVCLIIIALTIKKIELSLTEELLVRLPFSAYFGWITVSAIANVIALLVDINWNRFGLSEQFWAVAVIALGLVIGIMTMYKYKDKVYSLVIIWAYIGILIKHLSANGFAGQYASVIVTVSISIAVLVTGEIYLILLEGYTKDETQQTSEE